MTSDKVVVVIPARLGSSRFPGKPLTNILGLPMVEHVRRRVALCPLVDDVYVATCDRQIIDVVKGYGGKAVMTSSAHERCTDRVEEAARDIDADTFVIAAGDEPLFDPAILDMVIRPMKDDKNLLCTNLISTITDEKDLADKDIVKTVMDRRNHILFYSRAPIPFLRVRNNCPLYRQTGIGAFRKTFLHQYAKLEPTPMEIA